MNNFDHLQTLMKQLDQVEDGLKLLRDSVEVETKAPINAAVREAQRLRDGLWQVDKALEREQGALKQKGAPRPAPSTTV